MQNLMKEQERLEDNAYRFSENKANNIFNDNVDKGEAAANNEINVIIKRALPYVTEKIREYLTKPLRGKAASTRDTLITYIDREEELAYIVISSLFNILLTKAPNGLIERPFTATVISVSRRLANNIKLAMSISEVDKRLIAFVDTRFSKLSDTRRSKLKVRYANKIAEFTGEDTINNAITELDLAVATHLIECVITSKYPFVEKLTIMGNHHKKKNYITLSNDTIEVMYRLRDYSMFSVYSYPIFVIPPKPWTSTRGTAGYYKDYVTFDLIKIYYNKQNKTIVNNYYKDNPGSLQRLLAILNKIQETPWKINNRLLDVVNTIYKEGILSLNDEYSMLGKLPIDEIPSVDDIIPKVFYGDIPKEEYREYANKVINLEEKLNTIRSHLITTKLILSTANRYKKYDNIYFSYQVDFRGRLYPIQPMLNPQGVKLAKALLMFSKGKPLDTPEAVKWFKIHGANVLGYDKLTYNERLAKIDEYHSDILEIASDPLRYTQWEEADEPMLFLAWCFEYASWIKSPDNFVSHIPIAMDATCSGIQIYSGLMRDKVGATAVNVAPLEEDKVADIYSEVANEVNNILLSGDYEDFEYNKQDFNKSIGKHTIPLSQVAMDFGGKVNRSLTKRNTMTFPYNVSRYGMRDQVAETLKELEFKGKSWWKMETWKAATVLASLNFRGIKKVVKGAVECRDFIKDVAKKVSDNDNYIFYKTPIFNFPVLNRIPKVKIQRVNTPLGKISLRQNIPDTINTSKMVNGITPNIIHSLDATLMYYTLEKLIAQGLDSFALIHDSYGVHAADTELLQKTVREAYYEIFSNDILVDIVDQIDSSRTKEAKELIIDDLDVSLVKESKYFFS